MSLETATWIGLGVIGYALVILLGSALCYTAKMGQIRDEAD